MPNVGLVLGPISIDHAVPFHASARVIEVEVPSPPPTAWQEAADVQDTPESWLPIDPLGLGVFSIDHLVPFHASARVTFVPPLSVLYPTAVQVAAELQDTPESWTHSAAVGSGVFSIDHSVPFHASASTA